VIEIGPESPQSDTDFFALSLARARADAILVTGKILRAEPQLRCILPDDLGRWRGVRPPPDLVVLTRGRDLDPSHPALSGAWARPVIFTTEESAAALAASNLVVVGHPDPSARAAVDWAVSEGARVVSIEAGPSAAASLYDARPLVDEVLLSEFRGDLPDELRGGSPFTRETLEAHFRPDRAPHTVEEPSGPWRFTRWTRP
jgi:riboflavin biosynthesis pyrimidine reductase